MTAGLSPGDCTRLLEFRTAPRRFETGASNRPQRAGLTPAQHQLLLALEGHPGGRGPTIGEVAAYLPLRASPQRRRARQRRGRDRLVTRRVDSHDGRVVWIALTESARPASSNSARSTYSSSAASRPSLSRSPTSRCPRRHVVLKANPAVDRPGLPRPTAGFDFTSAGARLVLASWSRSTTRTAARWQRLGLSFARGRRGPVTLAPRGRTASDLGGCDGVVGALGGLLAGVEDAELGGGRAGQQRGLAFTSVLARWPRRWRAR